MSFYFSHLSHQNNYLLDITVTAATVMILSLPCIGKQTVHCTNIDLKSTHTKLFWLCIARVKLTVHEVCAVGEWKMLRFLDKHNCWPEGHASIHPHRPHTLKRKTRQNSWNNQPTKSNWVGWKGIQYMNYLQRKNYPFPTRNNLFHNTPIIPHSF